MLAYHPLNATAQERQAEKTHINFSSLHKEQAKHHINAILKTPLMHRREENKTSHFVTGVTKMDDG